MKVLKVTHEVHRDLRMVALSQDKTTAVLASQILRDGLDRIGVPKTAEITPKRGSARSTRNTSEQ